ncbi:hypothetical protein [Photorhabdus laumondii]|nr:hypothetical protein [Photorhabdus laumondii]
MKPQKIAIFSKNRRKPLPSAGGDIRRKAQRALGLATATYPSSMDICL